MLSICFSACVKDLDFNQAEELELEPAIATSLLSYNFNFDNFSALSGFDSTMDNDFIVDENITEEVVFSYMENTFINEDLDRIVPEINGNNTFEDDFTVTFTFLDENDNETYKTEDIVIGGISEGPYAVDEIVILNNPNVVNTNKIIVDVTFQGTVNPSEEKELTINLGAVFYFSTN